jgi:O-antigen/teichoic acid export membrane protein
MSAIKNISFFLVAIILSKALGFLQSFVVAKALGPANFGVWVTLLLLVSYAPIFSLGTVETLLKKVPYYLGRNELQHVREIENSVLGSIVLSAILVGLLALMTPFVLPLTTFNIGVPLAVMLMMTIAISYFSAYFYHRFSAYENFKMTGTMDAIRSAVCLIFVGGMAWAWGLSGAVTGFLLHEIVMFCIITSLNIRSHGRPGINFHRKSIIGAIWVGLPISLLWWVLTLTASVDRLVLGGMLGAVAVGYYALGISLSGILFLVPTVVGRVLYPKVNKHFGQNADAASMKRVVLAPTLALGTLLVNFQICLLVCTPLFYNQLLPKYKPGLMAGQILILGSFFVCLFRNGANYLIAANQERLFLKYIVATLVFNVLFDVGLVWAGFGTEGVALGTSLAGLFLTTLVWRRVLNGLGFQRRQQWATVFGLYLPMIVLVFAFGCLRLLHLASFQTFNMAGVLMGVLLLVIVNGMLWCFPIYRTEMRIWKKTLRRKREPLETSRPAADPVF